MYCSSRIADRVEGCEDIANLCDGRSDRGASYCRGKRRTAKDVTDTRCNVAGRRFDRGASYCTGQRKGRVLGVRTGPAMRVFRPFHLSPLSAGPGAPTVSFARHFAGAEPEVFDQADLCLRVTRRLAVEVHDGEISAKNLDDTQNLVSMVALAAHTQFTVRQLVLWEPSYPGQG
jgi:hypothetical protein